VTTDLNSLPETHQLGTSTKEWVVASERVSSFGATHARYAGYTEGRKGCKFVRHSPPFAMVLVTERGAGRVLVDGAWRVCSPGFAYLTAPRVPHAYHIAPGGMWRFHWVIYWEEGAMPSLEPGGAPRLRRVEATGLRHAVEGFCHEKGTRAEPAMLELWAALLDRAVLRVLDSEKADPRLDQLWSAVRQDLGAAWDLPRLARCAGMSEEGLRRRCQQHLQRSPMAQLTRMRMHAAADILQHTDEKLASLATRLGYADPFSFSTAFRRVMGRAPREWRERRVGEGSGTLRPTRAVRS
jgi:AraC-like DNA-binding protein/quercetin dioxygenase-like cupin family protein